MEAIFWILAIAVAALVAWSVGAARVRRRYRRALEDLASVADEGRAGTPRSGGELPGVGAVRSAIRGLLDSGPAAARKTEPAGGGAPGTVSPESGERDEGDGAILSALERIRVYLEGEVEAPLQDALGGGGRTPEVGARDALVALEDLYFYLRPIPRDRNVEDLNEIARDAGREYEAEWDVDVDVHVPERPTHVEVDREALVDAVYLALHNAGTAGRGEEVEVVVRYQEDECWLVVRDRGPGFQPEALEHAFEPFYTTSDSALGLGLYQVRRIVESMGGTVAVRVRRGGGGQLEIVLPAAASS